MHSRCFQILSWLLIFWQLLLPSGAPWLHLLMDGSCCTDACCVDIGIISAKLPETTSHSHSVCQHAHNDGQCSHSDSQNESESETPHDCSNCAVCQALAAPRILAPVVGLPVAGESIENPVVRECAGPLLGFGLPLQCRAPPVA